MNTTILIAAGGVPPAAAHGPATWDWTTWLVLAALLVVALAYAWVWARYAEPGGPPDLCWDVDTDAGYALTVMVEPTPPPTAEADDTDTPPPPPPPPPVAPVDVDEEWAWLQAAFDDVGGDDPTWSTPSLRECRDRTLALLGILATYPQVPKTRAAENLLLDELVRVEGLILERTYGDLVFPPPVQHRTTGGAA